MTSWFRRSGLAAVVFAALFAPAVAFAQAKCPEIPEVPWWFHEHDQIVGEVNQSQGGDWAKYIDRWERQRDAMEEIAVTNGRAVVRSHNTTLEGASLRDYIDKLDRRIASLKCLAAQAPPPPAAAAPSRAIPRPAQSTRSPDEIARAVAACPGPPTVVWWGPVSKQTMADAVKTRFAGDWNIYVQRWERELGRLNDALMKSQPAMMNDLGHELTGAALIRHIAEVANLILSIKCMAEANA